jgi:hypothetical protein
MQSIFDRQSEFLTPISSIDIDDLLNVIFEAAFPLSEIAETSNRQTQQFRCLGSAIEVALGVLGASN